MAEKQHNRKTSDVDQTVEEQRDPLAELARVVGYGDYTAQPANGEETGSGADLENELLRALGQGGDEAEVAPTPEGRPRFDNRADASVHEAADPADPMTRALEDDLLREFEHEDEPAEAPVDDGFASARAVPEADADLPPDAAEPVSAPSETQAAPVPSEPVLESEERYLASADAPGDPAPITETPVSADVAHAEDDAGDDANEGFIFPSADELESDTEFASQSWQQPYDDDAQADERWSAGFDASAALADSRRSMEADAMSAAEAAANSAAGIDSRFDENEGPAAAGDSSAEAPDRQPDARFDAQAESALHDESPHDHLGFDGDTQHDLRIAEASAPDRPEASGATVDANDATAESDAPSADETRRPDDAPAKAISATPGESGEEVALRPPHVPQSQRPVSQPMAPVREPAYDDPAEDESAGAADRKAIEANSADGPSDAAGAPALPERETAALAGVDSEAMMPDLDAVLREITAEDLSANGPSNREEPPAASAGEEAGGARTPATSLDEAATSEADDTHDAVASAPVEAKGKDHPKAGSLAAAAAVVTAVGDSSEQAFDPAAIVEHDARVEPLAELDVPALPGTDVEPAAPAADDEALDYDVDAALAQLVGDAVPRSQASETPSIEDAEATAPVAVGGGTAAVAAPPEAARGETTHAVYAQQLDPEDLERALDADLNEPQYPQDPGDGDDRAGAFAAGEGFRKASAQPPLWQNWKVLGGGVAIIAVIAGTVMTFGLGGAGRTQAGGPRIIAADTTPVKQKPKNPGGKVVPNQNKVVYNQVDGSEPEAPTQKTLVSSGESPIDVVQRTLRPDLPRDASMASGEPDGTTARVGEQGADTAPSAGGEPGAKAQDRLAPTAGAAAPTKALPSGVAPHYVKTMTVNAEGKLVAVDPQPAPAPAGTQHTDSEPTGSTSNEASQADAAAGPASVQPSETTQRRNAGATTAASAPDSPAPVPVARPDGGSQQTASASPQQAQPVAPEPEPAAPADANQAPKAADSGLRYYVQVSSQPTEAGARASYSTLSQRYASLIGGRGVDIQQADIKGKGTYYRVRIPATSRDDAVGLCQSYKSAGGSCFVTR